MMKRLLILCIGILIAAGVWIAPVYAASNFYGAVALTGGTSGALDDIDGSALATGDGAYVITSTAFYIYYLNASSGATESSPDVISPDDNAGTKRWLLIYSSSTFKNMNVTTVNAATYDLLTTDYILNVTYTATGPVTSLTLPTAQVVEGRVIAIKDGGGNAATNPIIIDTEGAETIDGAATITINSNYGGVWLYCDGTNWLVL
jgi:hypothetical protein